MSKALQRSRKRTSITLPLCTDAFTDVKKRLALLKGVHQEHIKWMEGSVTKGKLSFIAAVVNGLPVGSVGSL